MNEESKEIVKKKKKYKYKNIGRLLINVNHCHYPVVRAVAKAFNIKLTYSDDDDWDILWSDGAIQCDRLYRMKPY